MRGFKFPRNVDRSAKLIGIDPGSRFLGIAVLEYDMFSNRILKTTSRTIAVEKLKVDRNLEQSHGSRYARLVALKCELIDIFAFNEPIEIYCESNYFNKSTPSAYAALVETVNIVRDSVSVFDKLMSLTMISPSAVKAAVGVDGGTGKDKIQVAMREMASDIYFDGDFEELDNNAVDALAIVVTGFKQALP